MRSDIVPGSVFPDYELSDHTAKRRKLSELQGQHPMVLVLSRGGFFSRDRRQSYFGRCPVARAGWRVEDNEEEGRAGACGTNFTGNPTYTFKLIGGHFSRSDVRGPDLPGCQSRY